MKQDNPTESKLKQIELMLKDEIEKKNIKTKVAKKKKKLSQPELICQIHNLSCKTKITLQKVNWNKLWTLILN